MHWPARGYRQWLGAMLSLSRQCNLLRPAGSLVQACMYCRSLARAVGVREDTRGLCQMPAETEDSSRLSTCKLFHSVLFGRLEAIFGQSVGTTT